MNDSSREKQGVSDFVTRFTQQPDGIFFELQVGDEPGTVRLSSGPHKTLPEAQAAAAKIVREVLRARIEAAGIARCGERPAFDGPAAAAFAHLAAPLEAARLSRDPRWAPRPPRRPYTAPAVTKWVGSPDELARAASEAAAHVMLPVLEDEQLCRHCSHLEGAHEVLEGPCRVPFCPCDGFEAVAQVEAVDGGEVLS